MSKKQAYEEKFKAQLDELDAKIDVLKAKAKQAGASVKADYYETVEDLQKKRSEAQTKLQHLRDAGDDAWEDMKQGVEESWTAFAAAVKSAVSRFQ
jgi:multidrug resistance efflux pump